MAWLRFELCPGVQQFFRIHARVRGVGVVLPLRAKPGVTAVRMLIQDLGTYALSLEGRYHWNKRTRRGLEKAIECFEQVLARDAQMASAWTALADCHSMVGPLAAVPFEETVRRAKTAALKGLENDETLADAHASLGFITGAYEYDWSGAERHFRRALELNADCATAHLWYAGMSLAPQARHDEAEIHVRRACELDPLSAVMLTARSMHWLALRQSDTAIADCRRALDLDPGYPWAHRSLGQCYLFRNMYEEAANAFSGIEAPVFAAGLLGYCHARSGREHEARQLLDNLEQACNPVLAWQIAVLYLGVGDQDAALRWLDRAREARCMGIQWIKIEPIWDSLHRDSRFTALLQRMGLAD